MRLSKVDLVWIVPSVLLAFGLTAAPALWPGLSGQMRTATLGLAIIAAVVVTALFVRSTYKPHGYRSLRIEEHQFEYENLLHHRHVVQWNEIASVTFVREEEILPDLAGPFSIAKWKVITTSGAEMEVMDERSNRARLLKAFRKRLRGFCLEEAKRAVGLSENGTWLCFERMPYSASQPTREAPG
jgi:hypothetical protein